jgi:nitronate monooxygenase
MAQLSGTELDDFLNRMLEAERAGAKALVVFMDDWARHGHEWKTLRKVHEDEAHNCGLIGEQLKKRGKDYSHATGEFYDKAVAVKGPKERIKFLVRGLRWAIKEFEKALPRIGDPAIRKLFEGMRDRHMRSCAACESVSAQAENRGQSPN